MRPRTLSLVRRTLLRDAHRTCGLAPTGRASARNVDCSVIPNPVLIVGAAPSLPTRRLSNAASNGVVHVRKILDQPWPVW